MPICQKCKKPLKESYKEKGEVYGKNYEIVKITYEKYPTKKGKEQI